VTRRQRISSRLEAEAAKAAPQGYGGWASVGPAFTDAFRSRRAPAPAELVEAYKSIAYACAQINAGAVVRTPLRLYATTAAGQATPKGYRLGPSNPESRARLRSVTRRAGTQKYVAKAERVDEIAEHPLLRAIVNPNPDFDQPALLKITCLYLDVVGSAFWVPDAARMGYPTEFWPIQSQYVTPLRDGGGLRVRAWQYYGQEYSPEDILHFRLPGLKDPYGKGYAPLQAAFEHARLHDSYTSVQDALLGQGVRPSIIVSPKDPNVGFSGKDERARFEADINRKLSGGGAGRAWVTDGSIDVTPLTFPPSDLAAMEISDDALERFANCFGVPLSLLQTEAVNLANLEAGLRQHSAQAVEPRCVEIAGALTRWMHNAGRRLRAAESEDRGWDRLFFAFDDPVGEDQERKARIFDLQAKSGVRTINEIRTEMGEPPVPWGDEPWLPTALSQPSGDQRKPPPAPSPAIAPGPKPDPDEAEEPEDGQAEDAGEKAYRPEREDDADPFPATKSPPRIQTGGAEDNDPEDGEDNTFDLPDGAPLRRALRRWHEKQLMAVLGKVPARFDEIPLGPGFFDLSGWDREMGESMTPLLSVYWDEAGRSLRESIGLDPDAWQVTDPNLKQTIEDTTFAFCESTNKSTSDAIERAHDRLRDQIREGVLEEGEALPALTKRVRSIFKTLDKSHAELIAITETNRAVHLASLRSAKESGVVAGKRWLLSANACPLCHKIADETNNEKGSIGLDANFATVGSNPAYRDIKVPPGHPRCRCSWVSVLTDEYEALIPPDSPYWQNAGKAVPPGIESKVNRRLKDDPSIMATAMGD